MIHTTTDSSRSIKDTQCSGLVPSSRKKSTPAEQNPAAQKEGSTDGLRINTELKSGAEQNERTDPQKQPKKTLGQATLAGAEKSG
jgi:hypothetical protein